MISRSVDITSCSNQKLMQYINTRRETHLLGFKFNLGRSPVYDDGAGWRSSDSSAQLFMVWLSWLAGNCKVVRTPLTLNSVDTLSPN